VRSVIHEIRNHLAVAIANVEAFRDGVLEPTPKRLGAVLQALGEVEVLLRALPSGGTALSEELHSEPRSIDVCDVITNELLAFEATAREHDIGFHVEQCPVHDQACAHFDCDPVRVAEIVNNVVSNAIRYTPRGGRIDVDCRRSTGALTLTVTDSGPGVRSGEIGQIFEDGFRGSAAGDTEGSGVGLSLVKRFVEDHGGTIQVENIADRGARFVVKLPGMPDAQR
jgi:two-component system, OmpR family, sensor histidine kinase BaeS